MERQFAHCRGAVAVFLSALVWLGPAPVRAETVLVMVEEMGCVWCDEWNETIGPIYAKTDEGQAAPLVRIDLNETPPPEIRLSSRVAYTPTFVLVENGHEIGRIEGYPGEDFFWGLLAQMLKQAGVPYGRAG